MPREANSMLARRFFAEQDRLRGGPAPELCAPGYAMQVGENPPLDLAGHQGFAAAFYAGFPDLRHVVEDTVADDDRVAVRFTLHGTHTGDFMGIPATGRPIVVSAIVMMHVADGMVSRVEGIFDQLGMMRQLGAIPSQETAE